VPQRFRTEPSSLRGVAQAVRDQHVESLFGLQALTVSAYADLLSTLRLYVTEALSSPEQERLQDVWNLRVFGHGGGLRFTGIRQSWLRETAKRWAADELPRHRGPGVAGYRSLSTWLRHFGARFTELPPSFRWAG